MFELIGDLPILIAVPVVFVVGWIALVILYSSTMNAKAIIARGETLHWTFLLPLALGAVVGLLIDIVLNIPLGVIVFGEGPKKLTFSARVQHHVDESWGRDLRRAIWWGETLNRFDPRHIRWLYQARRRL